MTPSDIKSDINRYGWISRLPTVLQPYAILIRLDRPTGWWLLLLPGWWGILLGLNGLSGMYKWDTLSSDIRLFILFFFGAIIMRGAGCIINDLWDRDLDKQVERTKNRPLASGEVSMVGAIICLSYLLFVAFIILLMTSGVTILLGVLSLIFVGAYPLMKRITWWPQAFLGLTFNFGALMGWSAATNRLELEAFVLYAAGFFWTLGYDTIYAHQDIEDDATVGIKSTARLFGDNSKFWVSIFYTAAMTCLCVSFFLADAGLISFILLIFPAIHLMRQLGDWDLYDSTSALEVFQSNRNFGLWVLFAIAFMQVLPLIEEKTGFEFPKINISEIQNLINSAT